MIKWNVCGLCVENRYPMRRLHLVKLRRHNARTVKFSCSLHLGAVPGSYTIKIKTQQQQHTLISHKQLHSTDWGHLRASSTEIIAMHLRNGRVISAPDTPSSGMSTARGLSRPSRPSAPLPTASASSASRELPLLLAPKKPVAEMQPHGQQPENS